MSTHGSNTPWPRQMASYTRHMFPNRSESTANASGPCESVSWPSSGKCVYNPAQYNQMSDSHTGSLCQSRSDALAPRVVEELPFE